MSLTALVCLAIAANVAVIKYGLVDGDLWSVCLKTSAATTAFYTFVSFPVMSTVCGLIVIGVVHECYWKVK